MPKAGDLVIDGDWYRVYAQYSLRVAWYFRTG